MSGSISNLIPDDPQHLSVMIFILFVVIFFSFWALRADRKERKRAEEESKTGALEGIETPCAPSAQGKPSQAQEISAADALTAAAGGYIALDMETTGLRPEEDHIIELAAVRFRDGKMVGEDFYTTLIFSPSPIPAAARAVNGITDEMVKDAPRLDAALAGFFAAFPDAIGGETPICAHNAGFDMGFFMAAVKRCGFAAHPRYIDTLKLARRMLPKAANHKLGTLQKLLQLPEGAAHRAGGDAAVCGYLMARLLEMQEKGQEGPLHGDEKPRRVQAVTSLPKSKSLAGSSVRVSSPSFAPEMELPPIRREDVVIEARHTRVPLEETLNGTNINKGFEQGAPYLAVANQERQAGNCEFALMLLDKARYYGYPYTDLYLSYGKLYRKMRDYANEIVILDEGIERVGPNRSGPLEERRDKALRMLYNQQQKRPGQKKAANQPETEAPEPPRQQPEHVDTTAPALAEERVSPADPDGTIAE